MANFAIAAGAEAIGVVLFAASPRAVDVSLASDIVAALPAGAVSVVLVVNPTVALVESVLQVVRPTVLQFHGDESPEFCAHFEHRFWKAARVCAATDLLELTQQYSSADRLLLDADVKFQDGVTPQYGGTGQVFDWRLVRPPLGNEMVLSGGLTPDNVGSAIRAVRPWAVDVSSGVEESRGVKSRDLIRRFIDAVKQEDARTHAV